MTNQTLRPVPDNAPVANEDSAVIQGVERTIASTGSDSYKTEFVKVYQDAGVIGASMLTLLVLCFLLGIFSLRLLKMYVSLTESRDRLDSARTEFSSKLVERILSLESKVGTVITELRSDHDTQDSKLDQVLGNQERMNGRLDRYNEANVTGRRGPPNSPNLSGGSK